MSIFCSFWTGLFHRKGGLQNPTEDADIASPQDEAVSLERCSLDDTDLHLPVLEGFIMQIDDGEPSICFDKLDQLKSVTEHASILEEHCKSACAQNSVSSIPTGLLEGMDGKNKLPISDAVKQINDNYGCLTKERKRMHLDHRTVDRAEFIQKLKEREMELMYKRYEMEREAARMMEEEMALERLRRALVAQARPVPKFDKLPIRLSPVSRVWESLNTELPSIAEENENMEEIAEGNVPEVWTSSFKRIPKKKLGNPKSSKKNNKEKQKNNKEKQTPAVGASGVKCAESIYSRSNKAKLTGKTSLRGGPSLSEMEPKHINTVSSITSFIPLVQQKQAAAALPVKRDIKVKALKAAEEENERKTEREALKIQRARQEEENLRQLELQKKKKEEELKKKGADMAAKKRQREEEEKKEKERKRMRLEEARKQQREHEQKLHAQKQEKDKKFRTTNERGHEMKESKDEREKRKTDEEKGHSLRNLSDAATTTTQLSTSDERRPGTIHEDYEATSNFRNNKKMNNLEKTIENKSFSANTIGEQSYDISPYKESDDEDEDEDEDEDDKPNNKAVPLWASKINVALAREYQNQLDPEKIFPPEVSCSIAEVLLPRKYRL